MSPLAFVLGVLALVTSARTRVTVAGQPVPVIWLLALAVVLALAVLLLWVARLIVRDGGLRLRPRMVTP